MTAPAFAHDTIVISDSVDDPSPSGSFDWSAEPLRLCPTGCATVLDDDPSPPGSVDWSAEPLRICRDADAVPHVDPSPVSVTLQPHSDADSCTDTEPRPNDVDAFSPGTAMHTDVCCDTSVANFPIVFCVAQPQEGLGIPNERGPGRIQHPKDIPLGEELDE